MVSGKGHSVHILHSLEAPELKVIGNEILISPGLYTQQEHVPEEGKKNTILVPYSKTLEREAIDILTITAV